MLKPRMLASGILAVAFSLSVPAGILMKSDRLLNRYAAANPSASESTETTTDLEYAVALSDTGIPMVADTLGTAQARSIVSLPKATGKSASAASEAISINDPLVKRGFLEEEARKKEANKLPEKAFRASSGKDAGDDFVFDINKTIFPVTEEEVEMLKYVIEAEAGGGTLEGKRIVTLSITNRVLCPRFPNTLYEVLHARNQFSTIQNYYNKNKVPSETTCRAVEEVLMGACEDNSQNCMYFYCTNYPIAQSVIDWFENDLVYLYTIGCDRFFTDPS